jgi:hypothetical protein
MFASEKELSSRRIFKRLSGNSITAIVSGCGILLGMQRLRGKKY